MTNLYFKVYLKHYIVFLRSCILYLKKNYALVIRAIKNSLFIMKKTRKMESAIFLVFFIEGYLFNHVNVKYHNNLGYRLHKKAVLLLESMDEGKQWLHL